MPRSKPKTGTADFYADSYPLSAKERSRLVGLLALGLTYDAKDLRHIEVMQAIEKWLGFYAPAKKAFSNLPTPADYKRAQIALDADGLTSHDDVNQFHQRILDTVEKCRMDPSNAKKNANEMNAAIRAILNAQAEVDGRGRPREEVKLKLIRELRKIFAKYYAKGHPKRKKLPGAAEKLSEREFDEVQFIEVAFEAANISVIDNVRRLFMKPEGSLPCERNELLTRMANKNTKDREEAINQEDSDSGQ